MVFSRILWAAIRARFKLAAVVQSLQPIIGEATESFRCRLDRLNAAVDSYAYCVGDSMPEVA